MNRGELLDKRALSGATIVILSLVLSTTQCQMESEFSGFGIEAEQYEWSTEMKTLKITTQEIGLTVKVTITNAGSELTVIDQLELKLEVEKGEVSSYPRYISISYVYLPPEQTCTIS